MVLALAHLLSAYAVRVLPQLRDWALWGGCVLPRGMILQRVRVVSTRNTMLTR